MHEAIKVRNIAPKVNINTCKVNHTNCDVYPECKVSYAIGLQTLNPHIPMPLTTLLKPIAPHGYAVQNTFQAMRRTFQAINRTSQATPLAKPAMQLTTIIH